MAGQLSVILQEKGIATLTYKSLHLPAPNYLRKLFTNCSDERERFLRSSETDLKISLLKTSLAKRHFLIAVQKCGRAEKEVLNWPLHENLQRTAIVGDNFYFILTFPFIALVLYDIVNYVRSIISFVLRSWGGLGKDFSLFFIESLVLSHVGITFRRQYSGVNGRDLGKSKR